MVRAMALRAPQVRQGCDLLRRCFCGWCCNSCVQRHLLLLSHQGISPQAAMLSCSYHTATVINGEVWLCGGGDSSQVCERCAADSGRCCAHSPPVPRITRQTCPPVTKSHVSQVLPDVLVFNPAMRSWRQAHLQGDVHLLRRTAHGACVHPLRPGSILLMGGYGGPGEDFRCGAPAWLGVAGPGRAPDATPSPAASSTSARLRLPASTPPPLSRYLNDLVEVDTVAGSVRAVRCIGSPPELRAYHAFVACGSRCYCVAGAPGCLVWVLRAAGVCVGHRPVSSAVWARGGIVSECASHGCCARPPACRRTCPAGRMHDNRLVKGKQILVVWDASTSKWIVPGGPRWRRPLCVPLHPRLCPAPAALPCMPGSVQSVPQLQCPQGPAWFRALGRAGVVEGDLPPRSSLRVVAVPGGALAFGGAVDRGAKSAELHLLTGQGRLSWRACQLGTAGPMPAARGAHAMEVVGGRLYVVGGYGEVRAGGQPLGMLLRPALHAQPPPPSAITTAWGMQSAPCCSDLLTASWHAAMARASLPSPCSRAPPSFPRNPAGQAVHCRLLEPQPGGCSRLRDRCGAGVGDWGVRPTPTGCSKYLGSQQDAAAGQRVGQGNLLRSASLLKPKLLFKPAAAPLARPQKDAGAKQSGGSKAAAVPEASQWREARRSCPAAAFGAGSSKRQRLAAPSAAPTGAKAALPPSSGAVPATMVALPSATPVACTPAAAAMHAAVPPHSMPQQQQAAQQAPAAVALVPCMTELAELQQALHRERAAAVALQQQLADVMRESGEARADAAAWRRKAEEEQQLASQANAVLQQRTAEVRLVSRYCACCS